MEFRRVALVVSMVVVMVSLSPGQAKPLSLGFEDVDASTLLPSGLRQWGRNFSLSVDSVVRHNGKNSIRIEPSPAAAPTDFGCWVFMVPAAYEGSTVELRGFMKLQDVSGGFAGLIMRIDGESGMLYLDNMQQRGLRGTSDWQQYSVQFPLVKEAKAIYFGAILQGKGELWVDDLELLIDGKNYLDAKPKAQKVYKADKDKEFDKGSGITSIDRTPQTTDNLVVLGKVWGFLKYYHPTIAGGEYQWDYELFRVMRGVLSAKTKTARNEILSGWINKLGTVEPDNDLRMPDSVMVKMYPDLAWINDEAELGADLVQQLNRIKAAKRTPEHYYVGFAPSVGNPVFRNEKPYAALAYPDAGYRMLSLFRYWNMVQYFFPYRYLIGEDWKNVLHEFVPRFAGAKSELEYKLLLLELIGRVHDTHANIWQQDKTLNAYKGANVAPFIVRFVEDKAVVIDSVNGELARNAVLKKGDAILSVNGKPVADIIKAKLPITPASNYPTQLRMIASDLLRSNETTIAVSYERDGVIQNANVMCYPPEQLNVEAYQKKEVCWKFVADDVGYIYPGTIKNAFLPELMMAFARTKGIVVDMRCYPSDFIVFSLSQYLIPETIPFVVFTGGNLLMPGLFTFGKKIGAGGGAANFYKGKVVVLVNDITISQAEYTTMALRAAPNTVVLGSTTAGADGNVSGIVLPGGVSTMISGLGVYYPDGKETQRIGIVPDIEVKPTIKGIREHRDELLEKAIEVIRNSK
jgi:C-terminal processing protease CtpA/Prc